MSRYSKSRRDFLKQSASFGLSTLGMALLPFPKGLFSAIAKATTTGKRQHLINLCDIGGWDSSWYYNFFDPNLNSVHDNPPGTLAHLNKVRYASGSGISFSGQMLAPGMKFFTPTDLSRLLIWKGSEAISGHGQNNFFYSGGTSPYDASYSSLIAAYQADTRGQSVLHYVKLSSNIGDFWTIQGLLTGVAVPTCLPNQANWSSLTSAGQNPSMQTSDQVDRAIASLADAANAHLDRAASKGVVSGFSSGFNSANILSNSNYGTSPAFQAMWLRYFQAMKQEAVDQCASGLGSSSVGCNFYSQISGYLAPLLAFPISTTADLFTTTTDTWTNLARTVAWNFAMSAFLTINDLSAVVDVGPSSGDFHAAIPDDYVARMFGMVGFRELTRHLSSVPNPNASGTMLDCTLITYASEFDRLPIFTTENNVWGTAHGSNFSAMMAGHLSNVGRIVGSNRIGDASSVPTELKGADGPVGFDPNTGTIGGPVQNPQSLLPTVMAMFGAPIPPQQLTEYAAIPILMKAG